MKRSFIAALTAALLVGMLAAPAAARGGPPAGVPAPTIASTAVANPDFSILVTALSCNDLVGLVSSPSDNLTVFAPTNAAFNAIGITDEADCAALGNDDVAKILAYHVVPGRYTLGRVSNTSSLPTLSGLSIDVDSTFDEDGVGFEANNIQTSNGVIHVIDTVLLP